jgi:CDP-4-dehydro-6-deoxyglucose reductase
MKGYTYYDADVIDIQDISQSTKNFVIRVDPAVPFSFKAGQFIMLDLPIASHITWRSYSVASAPRTDNVFELCIVLKPDGLGTPYLFNEVKVGSKLRVSQPLGKFMLPDVIDFEICYICTGTGIAPFRSHIFDLVNRNIPHLKINLVFGNRKVGDILYRREFEELAAKNPNFNFVPVLSRETPETWSGKIGYVHPVYEELYANRQEARFYICGWQDMLQEARKRIEAMGYSRKVIKFESYD